MKYVKDKHCKRWVKNRIKKLQMCKKCPYRTQLISKGAKIRKMSLHSVHVSIVRPLPGTMASHQAGL